MQNIIRINVSGKGYSHFVGNEEKGFIEQPLGCSSFISDSYIYTEHRIDTILNSGKLSLSMAFRHDNNSYPVVAYGILTDALDDKGRSGITFIHALELREPIKIRNVVGGLIAFLSQAGIRFLLQTIADTASGRLGVNEALLSVTKRLEDSVTTLSNYNFPISQNVGILDFYGVKHDCAGAAPIAWSTLSCLVPDDSSGWEVYDSIDSAWLITTRINPSRGAKLISAFDILRKNNNVIPLLSEQQNQIIESAPKKFPDNDAAAKNENEKCIANETNRLDIKRPKKRQKFIALSLILGLLVLSVCANGFLMLQISQIDSEKSTLEKSNDYDKKQLVKKNQQLESEMASLKSKNATLLEADKMAMPSTTALKVSDQMSVTPSSANEYEQPHTAASTPKAAKHKKSKRIKVAPKVGKQDMVKPTTSKPKTAMHEKSKPVTEAPKAAEQDMANPTTSEPKAAGQETSKPVMVAPKDAEQDMEKPATSASKAAEHETSKPVMVAPKAAEQDMAKPATSAPKADEH